MAVFTIANNASLSDTIDLGCTLEGQRIVQIVMPSAWTAANLTFQAGPSSATLANLYDDAGNEVTVTAAASRTIVLDNDTAKNLTNLRFVALRSGTSGTPVNQGAARTITVITG